MKPGPTSPSSSACRPVALFGLFGIGNFGNEASLVAMLRHLRAHRPGTDITAICTYPDRVRRDHAISALPIRRPNEYRRSRHLAVRLLHRFFVRFPREISHWIQAIRFFRRVPNLVIPGTGILDDYAVVPSDLPYALFKWCVAARLAGARVLFLSVGAGPISHPLSRWLMKSAARAACYRSYRDRRSLDFMRSIKFDTAADSVFPDLVFSLPVPERPATPPDPGRKNLIVALGVMTYYGWANDAEAGENTFQTYIDKIVRFAGYLLQEGHSIRLVIGEHSDRRAADELQARLPTASIHSVPPFCAVPQIDSLEDVLREIAAADIAVVTRFHNAVCALMLDKPVVSIGYSDKNDSLLADMGLGAFCQHIDSFDLATLIRQFEEIARELPTHTARIQARRQEYQRRLGVQFDDALARCA